MQLSTSFPQVSPVLLREPWEWKYCTVTHFSLQFDKIMEGRNSSVSSKSKCTEICLPKFLAESGFYLLEGNKFTLFWQRGNDILCCSVDFLKRTVPTSFRCVSIHYLLGMVNWLFKRTRCANLPNPWRIERCRGENWHSFFWGAHLIK